MAGVSPVDSLGGSFVQSVKGRSTADASAIRSEFAELQGQLAPGVQRELAGFVARELSSSPDTAWMATLLPTASARGSGDAKQVLAAIRELNDRVTDPAVKKERAVSFFEGGRRIPLHSVLERLEAGQPLQAKVIRYEKMGPGLKAMSWALDYGTIRGVPLRRSDSAVHPVEDVAALHQLWSKVQLTENL